ncbi:MAG: uroporphyrinogen decarboxylase, partial [Pirellulaceae bacterium]|nr:uroporphyrinogen decarboxylase [Pirellulaceae bacterium]
LQRVRPLKDLSSLGFVIETVKQTRADLPAHLPLIGFSGAPYTLASYAIEGGGSKNFAHVKSFMYGNGEAWDDFMELLTEGIEKYLRAQIEAGAQCLQIFDSWAGSLPVATFRAKVLPYVRKLVASLVGEVPVIYFAPGNPALLPLLRELPSQVLGIGWHTDLEQAWQTVGFEKSVQGNLDPTVLLTDEATIREHVSSVLAQAAGRPGHIFNLGHGILPETPVENAIALVEAVHELSQR